MKALLLICLSQFCIALGYSFVNPILPLYASTFNISYVLVGVVLSSFGLTRIFFEIPVGILADRVGRKPVILSGYVLSAISYFLAGVARSVISLIISRMIMGVGSALLLNASVTHVGELTNVERRARYIAIFQSSFFIADMIGPTLGGFLSEIVNMRMIFLLSSIASVIAIFPVLMMKRQKSWSTLHRTPQITRNIREILTDPQMLALGASCFMMFFLFMGMRGTLVPLFGTEEANLTLLQLGIVFSLNSIIITIVLLLFTHRLEKRLGRSFQLTVSLLCCSGSVFLLSFASDFTTFAILMIPFGISLGILQPLPFSMLIDYAKPEYSGLAMGVFRTIGDLGVIVGPMIVGWLMDLGQVRLTFYLGAGIIAFFALITFPFFRKSQQA